MEEPGPSSPTTPATPTPTPTASTPAPQVPTTPSPRKRVRRNNNAVLDFKQESLNGRMQKRHEETEAKTEGFLGLFEKLVEKMAKQWGLWCVSFFLCKGSCAICFFFFNLFWYVFLPGYLNILLYTLLFSDVKCEFIFLDTNIYINQSAWLLLFDQASYQFVYHIIIKPTTKVLYKI